MDEFNSAGLALQKNLLNLRRDRDRLMTLGKVEDAARLDRKIRRMEAIVADLPEGMKVPTLQ